MSTDAQPREKTKIYIDLRRSSKDPRRPPSLEAERKLTAIITNAQALFDTRPDKDDVIMTAHVIYLFLKNALAALVELRCECEDLAFAYVAKSEKTWASAFEILEDAILLLSSKDVVPKTRIQKEAARRLKGNGTSIVEQIRDLHAQAHKKFAAQAEASAKAATPSTSSSGSSSNDKTSM
jgi:hypothetical protein